jgi:hypothetical protein
LFHLTFKGKRCCKWNGIPGLQGCDSQRLSSKVGIYLRNSKHQRNLLISEVVPGKEWIVKVTDFGLSRKVEKGKYYQKSGKTGDPIKWAAPVSLLYCLFSPLGNFQASTWKGCFQGQSFREIRQMVFWYLS